MDPMERLQLDWALRRLCDDYVRHADKQDFDAFVTLFTDDAVFEVGGVERHGHDGIRQHFADRPPMVTRHVCTNLWFNPTAADTAEGEVYLTVYRCLGDHSETDGPIPFDRPSWIGEYLDKYAKTAEGWKFAERRLRIRFEREE